MSLSPGRDVTLAGLGELIGAHRELGSERSFLRVRTVAVNIKDQGWTNFGTAVVLLEQYREGVSHLQLRSDVALIEACYEVHDTLSAAALCEQLWRWREVVGSKEESQFQETVYLNRTYSDPRANAWSQWSAQPRDTSTRGLNFAVPDGPFLSVRDHVFGRDVASLAAQYLGKESWANQHITTNQYQIYIPDRRARIRQISTEGQNVVVAMERRTQRTVYACMVGSQVSGEDFRLVVEVTKDTASGPLPFIPQSFEVWLTHDDGYALDHYQESVHGASWGQDLSLFHRPVRSSVELLPIAKALDDGESEVLEFKPYVRFKPRDGKADELLETASAFANTNGGDIYFGVNDNGEPQGLDRELARQYGQECRDSV